MNHRIGVLALQGGFELHAQRIHELGATTLLVRKESELDSIDGLIIPGGESSTLLKLCPSSFRDKISHRVAKGLPVLATCAGCILLAKNVENPAQESLGLIDIDVKRNAYGRQLDSFIASNLTWEIAVDQSSIEAVFIRAPRIIRTGKDVSVLIKCDNEPVLVRQGSVLAATFHPELSKKEKSVHEFFLSLIPTVH